MSRFKVGDTVWWRTPGPAAPRGWVGTVEYVVAADMFVPYDAIKVFRWVDGESLVLSNLRAVHHLERPREDRRPLECPCGAEPVTLHGKRYELEDRAPLCWDCAKLQPRTQDEELLRIESIMRALGYTEEDERDDYKPAPHVREVGYDPKTGQTYYASDVIRYLEDLCLLMS